MSFIKFLLWTLGIIFGVFLFFWLIGIVSSLLWYGFWIGLLVAAGYGGYKLFQKAERKALEAEKHSGLGGSYDINMSWDEYERKYLKK
jgi:4-hydroxybenzoate polyprenyltransferase